MSNTSGLPWWIFPLQGFDWIPPSKFILENNSVLFYLFMILLYGILSPGQLIIPALTLAIDLSFLLGSLKLQLEWQAKSQSKIVTSCLLKGKFEQLWDGSVWLTPSYGHLIFKSSSKDNQPSNIMKLGWVLYELCLLLPLERVTDMELGGFVVLINGFGIWNG